MTLAPIPVPLTVLHKPKGEPYHVGNSLRGVRRAHQLGSTGIDIDVNLTVDLHVVATHWSRPMRFDGFHDPQHQFGVDRRVSSMTLAEVQRLRASGTRTFEPDYRIRSVVSLMIEAAELGVTLCLEAKVDRRFSDRSVWRQVRRDADATGASVLVMAVQRRAGIRALRAVHAAGLPTMLLARRPVGWWVWQHLDYVKGPRAWTTPRPARVRRLGTSARTATRWGASCHVGDVAAVVAACRRAAR